MTNCQTCKDKIDAILSDLPSSWRMQITESICQVFTNLDEENCNLVKKCQTLTELSEFRRDGSKVCITYKDEDEISYERCFDFTNIINSLLDTVNPKCLISPSIWASLTFDQRIQLIVDRACHVATNTLFTTTSTTSTSSTSTTSTSTSTTSSSTTTSTTEVPVCGCFSIQNLTPSIYPVVYNNCGPTSIPLTLNPGQKKYVCSTFAGITSSIDQIVETIFLGDCSVCQQLNATTTTTSTSTTTTTSSTTTTTTVCSTNNVCINIFECATGAPVCDSPYIQVPFNLGITPLYQPIDVCGFTLHLIRDLLTDMWYLSEDSNDPVGSAVAFSPTLYGVWTNVLFPPGGNPQEICITINEVDQNLNCLPLPPTTTTTTSSTTTSSTTTSSSTTTTTTDPCTFNGGTAIKLPDTTTTSTSSTTSSTTVSSTNTSTSTSSSTTSTSSSTSTTSSTTTNTTIPPECYYYTVQDINGSSTNIGPFSSFTECSNAAAANQGGFFAVCFQAPCNDEQTQCSTYVNTSLIPQQISYINCDGFAITQTVASNGQICISPSSPIPPLGWTFVSFCNT